MRIAAKTPRTSPMPGTTTNGRNSVVARGNITNRGATAAQIATTRAYGKLSINLMLTSPLSRQAALVMELFAGAHIAPAATFRRALL
jgi:hypothetical protein